MVWIGFSRSKTPGSFLIRKLTKSPASHVWVSFRDISLNKTLVMEATTSGYKIQTWRRFCKKNEIVAAFEANYINLMPGIQYVADYLGTMYDYRNICGWLWLLFARWIGFKSKNILRDTKKLVCSEAVVLILQKCGVPGFIHLDPESTHPGTLLQRMLCSDEFTKRL